MKNTIKLFSLIGIIALAAIIGTMTGCASTDQQVVKKEGIAADQLAYLYLIYEDYRLERLDGKKQGYFLTFYGGLQGWEGILKSKERPTYPNEVSLFRKVHNPNLTGRWPMQIAAGEHTIVISDKAIIGRKNYEGTFNFEGGKRYLIRLVTPTEYEVMMKGATWEELAANAANTLKESLAGNQIVVIAEITKPEPTWFDSTIPNDSWIKSIRE